MISREDEPVKRIMLDRLWESFQRDLDYGMCAVCPAAKGHLKGLGVLERKDVLNRLFYDSELERGMGDEWQVLFSVITSLENSGEKRGLEFVLPFLTCDNALLVHAAMGRVGDIEDLDEMDRLLQLGHNAMYCVAEKWRRL